MKINRSHQEDREQPFVIYAHFNIYLFRWWRNRLKLGVSDTTTVYEMLVMIADRQGYSLVGYHFWHNGKLIWEGKKWTDRERKRTLRDVSSVESQCTKLAELTDL